MIDTRNNALKIYMLTLITFIVGTTQFGIVGMLDQIAASVGVSVATAGQLVTAYALGNAIGTPIVIVAAAKLDLRKQLQLALALILIGILMLLVLPGYVFLMVSRIILGIGVGVYIVTAYGAAAKLAAPGRQGSAMSNIAMGASSSLVFGVPLGRILATSYGWKSIFFIAGILSLFSIYAVSWMIPKLQNKSFVPLNMRLSALKNPRLTIALSVTYFVFIGFSIMDTYITPFLAAAMPILEGKISFILMFLGVGSLMGSKLGGLCADWIGTRHTIYLSGIVQLGSLVVICMASGTTITTIMLLMLWECSCWMFGPTQNFNLISMAPDISEIALSLNSTFVQLGFATGAAIGGMAVGHWSVMSITWISALSVAVALCIFLISSLLSDTESKSLVKLN